ncbi:MAG TPA: hypothetical protein VMB50_20000 [Myxococcales bacterium]|nr:hypothetical protein [Myxococcales bacterium]
MARPAAFAPTFLLALAAASCQKPAAPAPTPTPTPERPAAAAAAPPAGPQTFAPSMPGKSDPECVGSLDFAPPETITSGGHTWKQDGYRLTLDVAPGTPVTLGVVANLNEPSPENLKAAEAYLAYFHEKGVQAIVVDGDSGENAEAIEGTLTPFAKAGLPLLVDIGNRESKGGFLDAIEALRKQFPNVFNLSKAREVDVGDVKILSLPGYHDPRYLLAGADGCLYHTDDLRALKTLATSLKGPIVLVSHGPPHGDGPHALDRVQSPPGNVGDPNLTTFLAESRIPFGIFANIIEAGGTATSLHGDRTIAPGTWSDELYLNPGAADTVPWSMNDGTQARGLVATLSFKGGKAAYDLYRAGPTKASQPSAKR